jgi:ATP-binding cassette subfamily C protein LapB
LDKSENNSTTKEMSGMHPLETDRLAMDDPLLECLAILSRDHGRRTSVAALSSGLPVPAEGVVTPALFVRAADRIHMTAKLVRRPLKDIIKSPNLPCILLLKGNTACILKGQTGVGLDVIFPETPDEITKTSISDLEELFRGYAFFVRPRAKIDDRAGTSKKQKEEDWFWGAIWRHRKVYNEVALAAVMINLFALVSPIFIMNVYDRVLPNNAFSTLWVLAVGAIVIFAFDLLLKSLRAHFLDAAGRKADISISARIFEHMMSMKMSVRPPSAGALAAYMREFASIRDFFTSATVVGLIDFPFILLFLLLIFIIGGSVVIVPITIVAIVIAVGRYLQKPLAKVVQESIQEGAVRSSILIESLSGLETIKVQAAEGHFQRKWEELVEQSSLTGIKSRTISIFGLNFTSFMASISTVGIVLFGAYSIAEGNMTTGALIACVILSGRVMSPLSQVAAILTKFSQAKATLERLDDLMEAEVEREEGKSLISKPALTGNIVFDDVTFSYPGQHTPSLKNVSLEVKPGQHLGIIGAVGSGKTTLERLILNLYQPDSGSVSIDDCDVRQMDHGDLRRNIGVVQQQAYLFYGSVRDNITLGHEAVSDEAVLYAAEMAGVMDFLKDTPAGLDTPIGERGELLSGGQRQAIIIARALLYDPPILILDEPSASIDPGSEKKLYKKLHNICKGKTVILITHKSTLLGLVDDLILMGKGSVLSAGPRDVVLKDLQSGKFNKG